MAKKKKAPLVGHKRKMRTQFLQKTGPTIWGRRTYTSKRGHSTSPTKRHGSFPTAWRKYKDPSTVGKDAFWTKEWSRGNIKR